MPWSKLQNFEYEKGIGQLERDQPQRTVIDAWTASMLTCGIVESRPRAERVIEFRVGTFALRLRLLYDDPLFVVHLLFALSAL